VIYDITPAITPHLKTWPGDTPMSREVLLDMKRGDNITLSTLRSTVHIGAHADGPNHYGRDDPGIGERRLEHYLGPCQVIDAPLPRGERVSSEHIKAWGGLEAVRAQRVLIRTGTFPDPTEFNRDFAGISVELVEALAARGVITIGIDTPSVDLFTSKSLEAHHAILRGDIAILEGLVLRDVPAGQNDLYELIALPLKLIGFDASPVRAVLRRLP
jgi:arylformamidase